MSITRIPARLGFVLAAALGLAPVHAQTSDPGVFVPAPEGTVVAYHRRSEGSYGAYDGPVRWVQGRQEWNGRTLVSASSERHGASLMDPQTHGIVVQIAPNGQPAYSFNPPLTFDWPLAVGKGWTVVSEMTMYQPPGVRSITVNGRVEAYEDITVPAGSFKAFKVVSVNSFGETETVWTVPSLGVSSVRTIRERAPTHPLGAGRQEGVLIERTLPPK